jgi:hypothetical protein
MSAAENPLLSGAMAGAATYFGGMGRGGGPGGGAPAASSGSLLDSTATQVASRWYG